VLTKAVSSRAEVELLIVAISGGSDRLLLTASHQVALCIAERAAPNHEPDYFFLTKAPMIRDHHRKSQNLSQATRSIEVFWTN
jgi:hypothetical protein